MCVFHSSLKPWHAIHSIAIINSRKALLRKCRHIDMMAAPHCLICRCAKVKGACITSFCSSKTRLGPWTYVGRGLIQSTEDGTLTITEIDSGIASPPNSSENRDGLASAPRSQPRHHSPAGATLSDNQGIRLHFTSFPKHRQSFRDMQNETRYRNPLLPRWGALLGQSSVKP